MNKRFENIENKSPKYIQDIHHIIKEIFILTDTNIDIEMMNTTNDEKFAFEVQEEIYKSNIF